jgi:hypothetical protein
MEEHINKKLLLNIKFLSILEQQNPSRAGALQNCLPHSVHTPASHTVAMKGDEK